MRPQAFVEAHALALPLIAAPALAQNDTRAQNSQTADTMRFRAMDGTATASSRATS